MLFLFPTPPLRNFLLFFLPSPVVLDLVFSVLMVVVWMVEITVIFFSVCSPGTADVHVSVCVCVFVFCESVFKLCVSLLLQTHINPVHSPQKGIAIQFILTENGVKTQTEGSVAPRDQGCHLAQNSNLLPPLI